MSNSFGIKKALGLTIGASPTTTDLSLATLKYGVDARSHRVIVRNVAGGNTYTLEASADGITWFEIATIAAGVDGFALASAIDEPQWPFLRVNHTAGADAAAVIDVVSKHVPNTMRRS